jgi:hypothetical protein
MLLLVFAGSLAFDVLDRITGDWTVTNTTWMRYVCAICVMLNSSLIHCVARTDTLHVLLLVATVTHSSDTIYLKDVYCASKATEVMLLRWCRQYAALCYSSLAR